ncbi:MAG: 4Fe-4S dicluster domain-containing protein [Phycisphaerae bacterium]
MPKMIVVDDQRCLGCRSCMLQCALAHSEANNLAEALNSPTPPQPRVHIEAVGAGGMPLQCRHCEDAPCLEACPTEAINRPDPNGPILMEAERCIGCKFCLLVCPFGVIDLSRDGKAMIKCDLCIERTAAGKEPACVSACPTGALKFQEVGEFLKQRRRQAGAQLAAAKAGGDKK